MLKIKCEGLYVLDFVVKVIEKFLIDGGRLDWIILALMSWANEVAATGSHVMIMRVVTYVKCFILVNFLQS